MHSRIFQISTEPIDKENYLNEDTLQQGDGSFYDYCSEIDEENRKEDIANLVNYGHSCISPWQYNHVIQRLWTL